MWHPALEVIMEVRKKLLAPLIAVLLLLSGCSLFRTPPCCPGGDPTEVFVVSAVANQPADISPIEAPVAEAVAAGRTIIGITAADPPLVVLNSAYGAELAKAANDEYRKALVKQFTAEALGTLRAAVATTAEHNPFEAIALGNRYHPVREWVLSSLLSTAGPIRFQDDGMLTAEPDDVIGQLSDNIGKLSGPIELIGAGDVAPPQQPLTAAERANLIAIATGALTGSGADVHVLDTPHSGPGPSGPPVTLVPVGTPVITLPAATSAPIEVPLPAGEFFHPDSPRLLDEAAAREAVAPFVTWAAANPGGTIEINGLTARGEHPHRSRQEALGLARAEQIKTLLVAAGVAADRVLAKGLGSYSPWFVPETDPATGEFSRQRQALNRKIVVRAVPAGA
jgi:outer membrane protein OmpA-like peptidoglycan-associated protein